MYKFIYSEEELKWFYDNVAPELKLFETYFISLSARNKYLSKEEREKLSLGRTEMFERRIIRDRDWIKFKRTINKFECNEGGYTTKTGYNIPEKCVVVYFNINPSDSRKALLEFNNSVAKFNYELTTSSDKNLMSKKINKLDVLLMNCYQKNRGSRCWLDIDCDIPKEIKIYETPLVKEYIEKAEIRHYWIDTKSGYHLLIDPKTLGKNKINPIGIINLIKGEVACWLKEKNSDAEIKSVKKGIVMGNNFYEVVINKNAMVPLPGTLQAGHKVSIINKGE